MSLQDLPQLPPEYIPRVEKLMEKAKRGEVKQGSVIQALVPRVVAKVMPVLMREGGKQIAEMIPDMMSMLPAVMGKQIFVNIKGTGFFIARIDVLPKLIDLVPSSKEEIVQAKVPGIVIDPDALMCMLQGSTGIVRMAWSGMVTVYGADKLFGMFKSPTGSTGLIDVIPNLLGLLTTGFLMSLQEPFQEAVDEMLVTNGV